MPPQPRYPNAEWLGNGGVNGDGQGWGPLPDAGRGASLEQLRLIFHSTEGATVPGYTNGKYAPHITYLASERKFFQHAEFHRRVGTLEGRSRTGVLGNEFSVQLEIVGYSDKVLADARGTKHIWVGDFTDAMYEDLANFVAWIRTNVYPPHLKLETAYGPAKDFLSFTWGVDDPTEMSDEAWLAAGGILTAHGAAAGQSHWDTGVLDLHRIIAESMPGAILEPGTSLIENIEKSAARTLALIREWKRSR